MAVVHFLIQVFQQNRPRFLRLDGEEWPALIGRIGEAGRSARGLMAAGAILF